VTGAKGVRYVAFGLRLPGPAGFAAGSAAFGLAADRAGFAAGSAAFGLAADRAGFAAGSAAFGLAADRAGFEAGSAAFGLAADRAGISVTDLPGSDFFEAAVLSAVGRATFALIDRAGFSLPGSSNGSVSTLLPLEISAS
jgi:hypothetical protein